MDGQAVCSAEAGSGRHSFGTYHRYEVLAPSLMHWGFNQSLLHLVLVPAHHGCDSEIGSMTCLGFSVMQRLLLLHHNEQPLNCRMVPGSSKQFDPTVGSDGLRHASDAHGLM
jgi:hypothetical protein